MAFEKGNIHIQNLFMNHDIAMRINNFFRFMGNQIVFSRLVISSTETA
jgi:hypothetical protein